MLSGWLVTKLCLTATPWTQGARPPPCPSLFPRVCPSWCPLSQWCHPTISSSAPLFSFCLQSFPASRSFPISQLVHIRWPKIWSFSFSISPSKEHSRLSTLHSLRKSLAPLPCSAWAVPSAMLLGCWAPEVMTAQVSGGPGWWQRSPEATTWSAQD